MKFGILYEFLSLALLGIKVLLVEIFVSVAWLVTCIQL